jgi:hypothetical protein
METHRITLFLQAQSLNQSLPRLNEYLSQSTLKNSTNKPFHPSNLTSTHLTTTIPSRIPKPLRNSKKQWKKLELKHSLSCRIQLLKLNLLVDLKAQGAPTRHPPAVLHSVISSIKTEDP